MLSAKRVLWAIIIVMNSLIEDRVYSLRLNMFLRVGEIGVVKKNVLQ